MVPSIFGDVILAANERNELSNSIGLWEPTIELASIPELIEHSVGFTERGNWFDIGVAYGHESGLEEGDNCISLTEERLDLTFLLPISWLERP